MSRPEPGHPWECEHRSIVTANIEMLFNSSADTGHPACTSHTMCSTRGGADRGQHSNIHPYKHTTWSSCGKTGVYRHLTHFALTPASIIVKSSYENDFDIGNTGIGWVLNVPSARYYLIFIVTISPHELRSQVSVPVWRKRNCHSWHLVTQWWMTNINFNFVRERGEKWSCLKTLQMYWQTLCAPCPHC